MFAAFDLITDDRWNGADCSAPGRRWRPGSPPATGLGRGTSARTGAAGHRRGDGPRAVLADPHRRLRRLHVRRPVRPGRPDAGRAAAAGHIPGDAVLRPEISDGDLCVQACADDPQVVFHAVRNFARAARGVAVHALVAARLRPRVGDRRRPDHAAQPVRLQGRHQQHPRRRRSRDRRARLGRRRCRTSRGWSAAPIWSPARSGWRSRAGTPTRSATRRGSSAARRTPAPR